MDDDEYMSSGRKVVREYSLEGACQGIGGFLSRSLEPVEAILIMYGFIPPMTPNIRRQIEHDIMHYLNRVLRIIDELLQQELIGTRMAPFIYEERVPPHPVGQLEELVVPHKVRLSPYEKAQITRWRQYVQEAPLIDACTLVVQVLTDAVQEAQRRVARCDPAASDEERRVLAESALAQISLIQVLVRNLYFNDLFSIRFGYYIDHDPATIALHEELAEAHRQSQAKLARQRPQS